MVLSAVFDNIIVEHAVLNQYSHSAEWTDVCVWFIQNWNPKFVNKILIKQVNAWKSMLRVNGLDKKLVSYYYIWK